ncbi:ribonuclease T2 [Tothia fuscella]|uniref:Ribonuclease T2-like n=1 Tax=Tothia fuscella TaxID=1048955 RepID=A0A9P4U0Z0_9PEZI|nr:ribonuclease T2 [Tothia fuscella]
MAFLPSIKSLAQAAFFGSQIPLGPESSSLRLGTAKTCPNTGLSCPSSVDVVDTCCVNSPGGQFAQTQFWNSDASAGPPGYLGPNNSFTIHGLWPDHCNGQYDSVCDCSRSGDCSSRNYKCHNSACNRAYSSITNILQNFGKDELLEYMATHWKGIEGNEHLWQHEWSKHGTCVSTLETKCYNNYTEAQEVVDYFEKTVELYKSLPTHDWLLAADPPITPSTTQTYTLSSIKDALKTPRGVSAIIGCQDNQLREVWYHFTVRGSVQTGQFVASEPDFSGSGGPRESCPDEGIRWLPKDDDSRPSRPTTSVPVPTGTSTPKGKGKLVVRLNGGNVLGCLIGNGKWYNTIPGSSCASFISSIEDNAITLRSRKGPCGIGHSAFSCGPKVPSTKFQLVDGKLVADGGNETWYAAHKPSGTAQETIFTSKHNVRLVLEWRG